jgi:hypothetical protein
MLATQIDDEWVSANPLTMKRWDEYNFNAETLSRYGLHDITAEEAESRGFSKPVKGIYIQYPVDADSRIRYYHSGFLAQTDAARYGQRKNTMPAVYFPPHLNDKWIVDTDIPIFITEGEFKAIVVDQIANANSLSIVPLALGGVFNWQSKKLGVDLIPGLAVVKWLRRRVYIGFDADLSTNPLVSLAFTRLVDKLSGLGAECLVLSWPLEKGKGIDDYLCSALLRLAAWKELLAAAQKPGHIAQVLELNTRFTYVEREQQVWDRQNNCYVSIRSFNTEYLTDRIKVQVGAKNINGSTVPSFKDFTIGAYWLQSPARSSVSGVTFLPGGDTMVSREAEYGSFQQRFLNTWKGWGYDLHGRFLRPAKGDVTPFYNFLNATFTHEDPKHCDYLVKRLAWIFQQPAVKHPTWIYLIGAPYQGKSALIRLIAGLVGQVYVSNVDESALRGAFAEWRAEKLLVTLDDAAVTDRKIVRELLKRLTTEEHSQVNKKYQREYTAQNFITFFFASNGVDPLLDHDDRRALVLKAECKWDYGKGEWAEYDAWRATREGQSALLHHLMYEVKLDAAFLRETPPKTHAREMVVESGASAWDEFIYNFTTTRNIRWMHPLEGTARDWLPTVFTMDMLRALYNIHSYGQDRNEIKNGALSAKLVRYGVHKITAHDGLDPRGRIFIDGQQLTLWCRNKEWLTASRDAIKLEYVRLQHQYPELFARKNKF